MTESSRVARRACMEPFAEEIGWHAVRVFVACLCAQQLPPLPRGLPIGGTARSNAMSRAQHQRRHYRRAARLGLGASIIIHEFRCPQPFV